MVDILNNEIAPLAVGGRWPTPALALACLQFQSKPFNLMAPGGLRNGFREVQP